MPHKLSLLHNGFLKWIGYATAFCALVGSLWGGKVILDSSYAGAAEVRQQFNDLKLFLLKKDLRDLNKERVELLRVKEMRRLTDLESRRLGEVEQEIRALQLELKRAR
jgi:hypothetical protein